jgi:hypothetical protein
VRRRPPASLWIPAAVLLLVAAVTLVRAVDALREGDLRTAPAERTLYQWAAGDRRLDARLAAAAPALPPGVGVRLVVPAGTEEGWATFHGLYHLPQQRLLGIHRAGAPPPPADAWIVDVTGPLPRITPPRGAAAPQSSPVHR